jgi:short-chain fatty acids transporter
MGRAVPDAISATVIFLFVVAAGALLIGTPADTVMNAYYRGLWMLLLFTMQMTLVLVLGCALSSSGLVHRIVGSIARLPTSAIGVVAAALLLCFTVTSRHSPERWRKPWRRPGRSSSCTTYMPGWPD